MRARAAACRAAAAPSSAALTAPACDAQFGRLLRERQESGGGLFFVEGVPSSPRFAMGELFEDAAGGRWAATLVTVNWNISITPGTGPLFYLDNTTIWAGPTFAETLPLIRAAVASPVTYCYDSYYPPAECMSLAAIGNFTRPRLQDDRDAAEPQAVPAVGGGEGASSREGEDWLLPVVGASVAVAFCGAPRSHITHLARRPPDAAAWRRCSRARPRARCARVADIEHLWAPQHLWQQACAWSAVA